MAAAFSTQSLRAIDAELSREGMNRTVRSQNQNRNKNKNKCSLSRFIRTVSYLTFEVLHTAYFYQGF